MQGYSQKYTVIALLEDIDVGYQFPSNSWPLHITIADTFSVDWPTEELVSELAQNILKFKVANTIALRDEYFGPNSQTQVVILEKSKQLLSLHYAVLNCLSTGRLVMNNPEYAKVGFLPHSTVQPQARLNIGDAVSVTRLALIDMFPDGNPFSRRVLQIFEINP